MTKCCIDGCEKTSVAKGMCITHYQRLRRNGSPVKGASKQLRGKTPEERFWAYVEKTDGCWNWIGYRDPNGYGRLSINNVPILAHRFSYKLNVREITPQEHLLHRCDNPQCVNPDHLTVGDQAANNKDMFRKGRGRPKAQLGSANGNTILTEAQVREIRASIGASRIVAEKYGVSGRTVREIRTRKAWRHLE